MSLIGRIGIFSSETGSNYYLIVDEIELRVYMLRFSRLRSGLELE